MAAHRARHHKVEVAVLRRNAWHMSARMVLAIALLVLLGGCLGDATGDVADVPGSAQEGKSVWEERLDPDYFEYEALETFRLEYGEPSDVSLPTDLEYVSVWAAFFAPDPAPPPASGFPSVSGTWSDGSGAFEIKPSSCCGGSIPPASSGVQSDGAYQVLTDVPVPGSTLTIMGRNGGDGFYLEITIERATPVPLVGEPPYVETLDIEYFERVRLEDFRVDYPSGPVLPPAEASRPTSTDYDFLILSVHFVSETPAASAWVLGQPGTWPTIFFDFDVGSGVSASPSTIAGIPGPDEDTVEVIVRRPAEATVMTARTQGWGVGLYADVTVFGATPVDPGVEPEPENDDGRTSRG